MRNLLQIAGGIAVAGAVAAGTTAFTGAGFSNNIGQPVVVGGSLSPSIVGASLEGLTFDYNAGTSEVVGMTVRLRGSDSSGTPVALPTGSRVSVVSAGTKSASSNEFYCANTVTDTGIFSKSVCLFSTAAGAAQAGNITAMSALAITVQGPATSL